MYLKKRYVKKRWLVLAYRPGMPPHIITGYHNAAFSTKKIVNGIIRELQERYPKGHFSAVELCRFSEYISREPVSRVAGGKGKSTARTKVPRAVGQRPTHANRRRATAGDAAV